MMKKLNIATFMLTFAVASLGGILTFGNHTAQAASSSGWNASNIIDDAVFYDNTAMSTADIQDFMNSKNPSCDTQGTQPASEYGRADLTHAQYAASVGWPGPPYVCLRDYYQIPRSDQNINNLSTNVRPEGSISAAEIIKRASDTYGLNPKVLLVLIQKESVGPLLTDTWPIPAQYRSVVGYACPDTAPCDPKYAGFYNQIMNAAYQFKYYKDHAYDRDYRGVYIYNHQPYNTVPLRFNPNASCGSTQTRMDNYATTGLYNYTPYQPNQAALNNMYGTGDDCSAYGNRNFWRMFTDWFGSTRNRFVSLDTPRWMVLSNTSSKLSVTTSQHEEPTYTSGTQLRFVDKIFLNNTWYLRTAYDSANNIQRGFPIADTADIAAVPLSTPRYMELNSSRQKWNPASGIGDNSVTFPKGTHLKFASKVTVNNIDYYRTEYDTMHNKSLYITSTGVGEIQYENFVTPRYMQITKESSTIDPVTGRQGEDVERDLQIVFNSKIRVGDSWYYRSEADTASNRPFAIKADNIQDVPYEKLGSPTLWLQASRNTLKYTPNTQTQLTDDVSILKDQKIKVARSITVNGTTYYQTAFDVAAGQNKGIPSSDLIPINYTPMTEPRYFTLNSDSRKINPSTSQYSEETFPKGTRLFFSSKINIDNKTYLRTQFDTTNDNELTFPMDILVDK